MLFCLEVKSFPSFTHFTVFVSQELLACFWSLRTLKTLLPVGSLSAYFCCCVHIGNPWETGRGCDKKEKRKKIRLVERKGRWTEKLCSNEVSLLCLQAKKKSLWVSWNDCEINFKGNEIGLESKWKTTAAMGFKEMFFFIYFFYPWEFNPAQITKSNCRQNYWLPIKKTSNSKSLLCIFQESSQNWHYHPRALHYFATLIELHNKMYYIFLC